MLLFLSNFDKLYRTKTYSSHFKVPVTTSFFIKFLPFGNVWSWKLPKHKYPHICIKSFFFPNDPYCLYHRNSSFKLTVQNGCDEIICCSQRGSLIQTKCLIVEFWKKSKQKIWIHCLENITPLVVKGLFNPCCLSKTTPRCSRLCTGLHRKGGVLKWEICLIQHSLTGKLRRKKITFKKWMECVVFDTYPDSPVSLCWGCCDQQRTASVTLKTRNFLIYIYIYKKIDKIHTLLSLILTNCIKLKIVIDMKLNYLEENRLHMYLDKSHTRFRALQYLVRTFSRCIWYPNTEPTKAKEVLQ